MKHLDYRRRRGRIKTPPADEVWKSRIRPFFAKMDLAERAEEAEEVVIVYMDESFVQQAHGSAYSFFPSDEDGVVQDGIDRTTGKGLPIIL